MLLRTRPAEGHWRKRMPSGAGDGNPHALDLSPGELVRIRSAREIFSTLDENGTLDNLPFMPEMLQYCGRTFPVFKRADKTCNGSHLRRLTNVVHLSNLRCDGAAHGGCQAACLMYWKEAWLERVGSRPAPKLRRLEADEQAFVAETLVPATAQPGTLDAADRVYRCQATDITNASTFLHGWKLNQYVTDVRNWGLRRIAHFLAIELFNRFQIYNRRFLPRLLLFRGGRNYPFVAGQLAKGQTPAATLDLRPGDVVRIKSKDEILKTLDRSNCNRGLSFDVEMLKYCARTARVRGRVERLVDEQTGRMINIKRDCIILEGVVCSADYHRFCTRSTYSYWREIWLERVS